MPDDKTQYLLLTLLERNPGLSQRELAEKMGVSLGKTNYCLNALIDKGLIEVRDRPDSRRKLACLYTVTPDGKAERALVTRQFLSRKLRERQELSMEIERLRAEIEFHRCSRSSQEPDTP